MIQGRIEGGLDDAFRFGDAPLPTLSSRLRENDGSFARVSLAGEMSEGQREHRLWPPHDQLARFVSTPLCGKIEV